MVQRRARALRHDGTSLQYNVTSWYDLTGNQFDPFQTHNLYTRNHSSTFHFTARADNTAHQRTSLYHLLARLDSLILVLKTCKARECTHPWEVLHPDGQVKDLHDALHERFDDFYEVQQKRVSFSKCEKGYILESEGPIGARACTIEEIGARGGGAWSDLV